MITSSPRWSGTLKLLFLVCCVAGGAAQIIAPPGSTQFITASAVIKSGPPKKGTVSFTENGVPRFDVSNDAEFRIFSNNVTKLENSKVYVTTKLLEMGLSCDSIAADDDGHVTHGGGLSIEPRDNISSVLQLSPSLLTELELVANNDWYLCISLVNSVNFYHQGSVVHFQTFSVFSLPLPLHLVLVVILLCCSALFSGLNLGLMALDVTELQLVKKCGSDEEKRLANVIEPIRRRGNMLLVTLLLGNTLVNATLTLLIDDLIGSGVWTIVGSTAGILVFGEIIPQSVCSRYGLKVGYYTRFFTLTFMFLLFPLTYLGGKLLDFILGEEIPTVYDRSKLREIVIMQASTGEQENLMSEEAQIIMGTLESTHKPISDIMRPKNEIFMVGIEELIDYDLINEIVSKGYTRIPVFQNGDRNDIVGILNAKDMLGIDPDDKMPLNSVVEFYGKQRQIIRVDSQMTILEMLKTFQKSKIHLAIVTAVVDADDKDPTVEMIGIVTLEDVIESILKFDFVDETDQEIETRKMMDGKRPDKETNPVFYKQDTVIPQQLCLAAVQFMTANVEPFKQPDTIDHRVLVGLLRLPEVYYIRKPHENPSFNFLYRREEMADYFILLLQGTCHVMIGQENLPFEAGPFHYFGVEALPMSNMPPVHARTRALSRGSEPEKQDKSFKPDFSVQLSSEVHFVRLKAKHWNVAYDLTRMCIQANRFDTAFISLQLGNLLRVGKVEHTKPADGSKHYVRPRASTVMFHGSLPKLDLKKDDSMEMVEEKQQLLNDDNNVV